MGAKVAQIGLDGHRTFSNATARDVQGRVMWRQRLAARGESRFLLWSCSGEAVRASRRKFIQPRVRMSPNASEGLTELGYEDMKPE